MKLFNAFVLSFGLTAVLIFFGACSKENVSDASKATEVNDLKAQIEDLRNQVQGLEGIELTGNEVVEPDKEPKIKSQKERANALVKGIVSSVSAEDFQQFRKFTCLGMGKEAFKAFMVQSEDRKVLRVWDSATDDFFPGLENKMKASFDAVIDAGKPSPDWNWDWSNATIKEVMLDQGDVKAVLSFGGRVLGLHVDDIFDTPNGLLTFDGLNVLGKGLSKELNKNRGAELGKGFKQGDQPRKFKKLSPFTKVSCAGHKALVTYSGKEYELMSIDDIDTKQILDFCKKTYSDIWEKRFAEDLVEVMSGMGKEPGISVKLTLKDLAADKIITVNEAPMTEANRLAVWKGRK
jgi:hypothetical protein